jgi:hypothetical protein
MDLYTFNSVINSVSIRKKNSDGVVSDSSGPIPGKILSRAQSKVHKPTLMVNIMCKLRLEMSSFLGMIDKTVVVVASSTVNVILKRITR